MRTLRRPPWRSRGIVAACNCRQEAPPVRVGRRRESRRHFPARVRTTRDLFGLYVPRQTVLSTAPATPKTGSLSRSAQQPSQSTPATRGSLATPSKTLHGYFAIGYYIKPAARNDGPSRWSTSVPFGIKVGQLCCLFYGISDCRDFLARRLSGSAECLRDLRSTRYLARPCDDMISKAIVRMELLWKKVSRQRRSRLCGSGGNIIGRKPGSRGSVGTETVLERRGWDFVDDARMGPLSCTVR